MVVTSFIHSILDIGVLYSLFPVMYVVTHQELIEENKYLNLVYEKLGFETYSGFIVFLFVFIVIAFAFRALVSIYINNKQLTWSYFIGDMFFKVMNIYLFNQRIFDFKRMGYGEIEQNCRMVPYQLSYLYLQPIVWLITEVFVIVFLLSTVTVYNYKMFLVLAIGVFIPAYLIYRFFKNKMENYGKLQHSVAIKINNIIKNTIRGYADIYLMHKQDFFIGELLKKQQIYNHISKRINVIQQSFPRIVEWIAIFSVCVLFMFFAYTNMSMSEITLTITVYFASAYRIMPSVNRINASLLMIKQYEYLIDIYKEVNIQLQRIHQDKTPDNYQKEIRFDEKIKLCDVEVSYLEDKSKKVLSGINLEINKSEMIGIIGESGAGKSTLMYVIAGLITPDKGYVEVDNVRINEANILAWHKHISIVFQEPYIVDGNWKDNIAFGGQEINEEKMWECLRLVQLEEYVRSLPGQLDENIGDGGAFLSGGQKQRLALARALYREADVLLLDEATSALDEETQKEVMTAIEQIRKQRNITVIIVAHRYSSLKYCNRILLLEKGQVTKNMFYSELASSV
jgi:ABC-type bacteriocin/lantibiotic exporter with double-glycine peptidase domain